MKLHLPFHDSTNANVLLQDNTKTFGILSCKSFSEWQVSYQCHTKYSDDMYISM